MKKMKLFAKLGYLLRKNPLLGQVKERVDFGIGFYNYNDLMGGPSGRTASAVSHRWCTMQQHLEVFCDYLKQLECAKTCVTLEDRITRAKQHFFGSQKCVFRWDTCWEILKDDPKWKEYLLMKDHIHNSNKRAKLTIEMDTNAFEGESSTPTTHEPQPITEEMITIDIKDANRTGATSNEEIGKKSYEQIVHLSKVVEESNSLMRDLISSFDDRFGRSEEIARKNLQLKEEKIKQRQLEMQEKQFESDKIIMDMNLDHMPLMQRQFYEVKQREICAKLKIGESDLGSGGSSGGELDCDEGLEV